MKVVHIVLSENFAGIEQHVDEILSNISVKNFILICNNSIAKHFNKDIEIKIIKNIGRRSFLGKYKLKKLLEVISPDIVHTHGSKTTSIINSIKNNYKHVATVHGIKKKKKVYEKCDLVIGVSNRAIENIHNKSIVISNWWNPQLKKSIIRKNKYALAVGRLEKVKGFDLLISSWTNIKTKLVIVGSGKEKENLLNLIKKNNLSNKVEIVDEVKREDLISYYENASVLIVSSRDEGGPRVALESLYIGIPVLSTDVGHMPDILPRELLAKKDDSASLQQLLELYVDSIDLIDQSAIFEFVKNEFSIEESIDGITSAYEGLLNN
jgi:glycosyltransferase involved in cell wall biosynthesis